MSSPTFDTSAVLRLAEHTEYEAWFLEAVYAISEQELFPVWPEAVIYPLNRSKAQFFAYARGSVVVGDWRRGFLNAGAPLVFISTFKILDMLVEWVLEENGSPPTFRFETKIRKLANSPTSHRRWSRDRG